MSVEETNQIDFASVDKDNKRVLLTIADHLGWNQDEGEHLLLLQEKLNTYLHFIESGKLEETYPWAKGLPVAIKCSRQISDERRSQSLLQLGERRHRTGRLLASVPTFRLRRFQACIGELEK